MRRHIHVGPGMTIQECHPTDISFSEILSRHLCQQRIDPMEPYLYWITNMKNIFIKDITKKQKELRTIYDDIRTKFIPKTILKEYVSKIVNGPSLTPRPLSGDTWVFRLDFTRQLVCQNILWYAFSFNDDDIHSLTLRSQTGELFSSTFGINYDQIKKNIPFRLTPNIAEFLGPHVIRGLYCVSFVSGCASFLKSQRHFKNYLYLHIRDDLINRQLFFPDTEKREMI
eukprot:UN27524